MIVHVFGTTFEYQNAPAFVLYLLDLITAKWGSDLDAAAPVSVRLKAFQVARIYALPGTPIAV